MTSTSNNERLTRDGLIRTFNSYCTPRKDWLIGAEFERHLLRPNGQPVPYFGEDGVSWLLEQLASRFEWERHYEGEHLIALKRRGAWFTLEPGGQLELSGAPYATLAEVQAEQEQVDHEIAQCIGGRPIVPVYLGFTPIASITSIDFVPKSRYGIMQDHLGQTGPLAHHMMKGTCAVQATYDFSSEADCAQKVALGLGIAPLTTALFANSPLIEGEASEWSSYRGHIWTHTDPARTGFPEAAHHFTFERWVDYLLDVPMMFVVLGGEWRPAHGLRFRTWLEQGIDGRFPTMTDWELHLTSVFPEVRVKHGIEVRGADCVNPALSIAFCALFKGLYYDAAALGGALELLKDFRDTGSAKERFDTACLSGLKGRVGARSFAEWAGDFARIARDGLPSDERAFLDPLDALIASGKSPAAHLLSRWDGTIQSI